MPISSESNVVLLHPNQIIVGERQRTSPNIEDVKESISRLGVLHPILITRDNCLIAGYRRLKSCEALNLLVPCRYYDTLATDEAEVVELEENLKRSDLGWQDYVRAVIRIHNLLLTRNPNQTQAETGAHIGLSQFVISRMLSLEPYMNDPRILAADGWQPASNVVERINARRTSAILTTIMDKSRGVFTPTTSPPTSPAQGQTPSTPSFPDPISVADFRDWAPAYSGPSFNLIHCDFPYGIDTFRGPQGRMSLVGHYTDTKDLNISLIETLLSNLDNLLAPSGHVFFWFSMQFYEATKRALETKLRVNPYPLVWLKSDNTGVAPDPLRGPRQIYETAFLCWRGEGRPIVRVMANAHAAPTDKSLHPSAKPEPVLKHFFTMLVDNTTRLFDPTCGSGSALRAAEALGANFVLGIDTDAEHVQNANDATRKSRILRQLST